MYFCLFCHDSGTYFAVKAAAASCWSHFFNLVPDDVVALRNLGGLGSTLLRSISLVADSGKKKPAIQSHGPAVGSSVFDFNAMKSPLLVRAVRIAGTTKAVVAATKTIRRTKRNMIRICMIREVQGNGNTVNKEVQRL